MRANFYKYKAQFGLAIKIVQGSNDAESTEADRKIFYSPAIVSINVDYGSMPRRFDVFHCCCVNINIFLSATADSASQMWVNPQLQYIAWALKRTSVKLSIERRNAIQLARFTRTRKSTLVV